MLVLKRDTNERIIIEVPPSDETTRVEIQVVERDRNGTRLGIAAPPAVRIDREEIWRRRQAG